jgi:hypothetical protein
MMTAVDRTAEARARNAAAQTQLAQATSAFDTVMGTPKGGPEYIVAQGLWQDAHTTLALAKLDAAATARALRTATHDACTDIVREAEPETRKLVKALAEALGAVAKANTRLQEQYDRIADALGGAESGYFQRVTVPFNVDAWLERVRALGLL